MTTKTDWRHRYWEEALATALEDAGAPALTSDQLAKAASALLGAHENESQASGVECIPNPLRTEIDRLKESAKRLKDDAEDRERNILGAFSYVTGRRLYFDEQDRQVKVDPWQ